MDLKQAHKNAVDDSVMAASRDLTASMHMVKRALNKIAEYRNVQKMWLREDAKADAAYDAMVSGFQKSNIVALLASAITAGEDWLGSDHSKERDYLRNWWFTDHNRSEERAEKSLKTLSDALLDAEAAVKGLKGFQKYMELPEKRKNEYFREMVDEMFDDIKGLLDVLHNATSKLDAVAYLGNIKKLRK